MTAVPAEIVAVATAGGPLLVLAILLPVTAILLIVALGGRWLARIVPVILLAGLGVAIAIFWKVSASGAPLVYVVGGWQPPLGIALRADGIAAAMMAMTAIIICGTAIFAWNEFMQRGDEPEARKPIVFWCLLLAIWSALNALFISGDLFNLYVAIELVTFAAVPLVCLKGSAATLQAALRYMLFAVLGSMLYLLGTVMIYGAYGTLDISMLAGRVRPEPIAWIAASLMTLGLLAKTALFPLHLWLPPAHAGAPAAGSAVLSALVVKGSFFVIVRIWFDAMPALREPAAMQLLAGLGSAAILFGSVLALRQHKLKQLIAYSTVAQIGYLFFMFPLVTLQAPGDIWSSLAWTGGWLQLGSHAFAKAAMFMAAGLIADCSGQTRIDRLGGTARHLPVTALTFALAGLSLMGVPPSGGFTAKWMLLVSAVQTGQWLWSFVILAGGLIAAAYVFKVVGRLLADAPDANAAFSPVARLREFTALGLALVALLLGVLPLEPSGFLQIGLPSAAVAVLP
jgi:formate hydrogenlyase subunit 3/multisubunit Na+/H+ antiporter MnhD subunit